MLISRKSQLTGKTRIWDIDVTDAQMGLWMSGGRLIQDAMPHLTDDEREFIMTGITPDEWDEAFGEDEEWMDGYPDQDHYDQLDEDIWRDEDRISQRIQ